MSLLLSSLKKADEESQKSPQVADGSGAKQAAAVAPPVAPVASVAPAASGVAGPASTADTIDFDNIAPGNEGGDSDQDQRQLVSSAMRVFKAGGDSAGSESGRRSPLVGIVALIVVVGAGAGAVVGGLIPGVSVTSIIQLIGIEDEQQVVQTNTNTGPVLAVARGEGGVLSLPRPVVDVQASIVEFAGFQQNDVNALNTPEGRRALADSISGFIEEAADEDVVEDLQIIELDEEELLPESEEEAEVLKTADSSRSFKQKVDSRTSSDRLLSRGVVYHNTTEGGVLQVAQASTSETTEITEPVETNEAVASVADDSAGAEKTDIRIKPSLDGVSRKKMLEEARRLYIGASYTEAEVVYRNVLSKNETNLDALRGLALVAVATGRHQLAVATYLQILEYYPNDPVAVADLTNLHGISGDNFYAVESALKNIIGNRPEWDSRLHFALGNLYAGAERWLKAQTAYFEAYSGEPTNPDYAYNLAVVLDYLNKPSLAVVYYREALQLSERAPSGFDVDQIRARIADISQ